MVLKQGILIIIFKGKEKPIVFYNGFLIIYNDF